MKTLEHRTRRDRGQDIEADLEATVFTLFQRCPLLCGFAVQALESDLFLGDVSFYPSPGQAQSEKLCGEIAAALLELIDERPEARELLCGRTFARTLH
jgi:hypothetical protein